MLVFYKIWKEYNEFPLTKNKMDLNNKKMRNDQPSPRPLPLLIYIAKGFIQTRDKSDVKIRISADADLYANASA